MEKNNSLSRRTMVKSSVLGLLTASLPGIVYSRNNLSEHLIKVAPEASPHDRHPAIELEVAAEVVGVAHSNLKRLKELVDARPELAKAQWDWAFGDWESAIAAASHVGRKDIVDYLISKGAVPTIFTYAMLGQYETVKAMIKSFPGIQKNYGPHGISLMQHAKLGLDTDGVNKSKAKRLVDYLQSLGDADGKQYLNVEENEKGKYLGDYKYGEGKNDGFTIKLNMKKFISLGKLGKTGGALWRIGDNEFTYQGAPSVTVKFLVEEGKVLSLILTEPGLTIKAVKV